MKIETERVLIEIIDLMLSREQMPAHTDAMERLASLPYEELVAITDLLSATHGLAKLALQVRDFDEQRGQYAWRKGLGSIAATRPEATP